MLIWTRYFICNGILKTPHMFIHNPLAPPRPAERLRPLPPSFPSLSLASEPTKPPRHRVNAPLPIERTGPLLEEEDSDPDEPDDGDRFHYSIERKVRLNGKADANQSDPNVVVSFDWRLVLHDRLEQVVRRRFAKNRRRRHEHTAVVVSVTERSQRDLSKEYEGTEMDWAVANKQLLDGSSHFQRGKKLRVNLSFHFLRSRQAGQPEEARRRNANQPVVAC
ncbi:hypothetical protein, variant [Cladophialophora immunda]|uniref:Uncharacterized protein n=1 Tax=Cladophialophora immunda TaxID=569365 RepID=A0A0D1Z214_9EURO|nr:uncharacterized protein PV07_12851 [Cladophialophora immunda]XP_016241933.1 hypothetical protein, variant [Cladophialophora immunda]KIW21716.1 hypothetical protein PV07_12851 [Cladophialophora immunda]KIW21717.1 hypothetical protein, variant [Cladophialophora immunda]